MEETAISIYRWFTARNSFIMNNKMIENDVGEHKLPAYDIARELVDTLNTIQRRVLWLATLLAGLVESGEGGTVPVGGRWSCGPK